MEKLNIEFPAGVS